MILKNAKIMDDTFTLVDACLSTDGEKLRRLPQNSMGMKRLIFPDV